MRAVFADDHIFERNSDGVYLSEKLPYTIWRQRYLSIFDGIDIVARSEYTGGACRSQKGPAVGPKVNMYPVPSLSSPWARIRNSAVVHRILDERIQNTDCVIARMPSEIGEAAIAVARKQRKPTAIEMVACAWDTLWNYGTWQGKVYAPISYLRTRAALAKASHVIYVTEKFLQTRYPTNGKSAAVSDVVISPSSPDVLKRRVARESADRRSMNIGLVGNLSPIKGIGTLIRAASYLRQRKVPKFELRFLGGGAQERWQKLAHKLGVGVLCDFCGVRPPGRAVWEWLDAIDIYVQPSCTEGLPRATVEAMSRACPVIGSAVGGLPELLPRENMHRPRDARRLADLIEKMLMTPTWRVECSRANFYKAQDYSLDVLDRRRQAFWCNFTEGILASHDCRNNRRVIV